MQIPSITTNNLSFTGKTDNKLKKTTTSAILGATAIPAMVYSADKFIMKNGITNPELLKIAASGALTMSVMSLIQNSTPNLFQNLTNKVNKAE